MKAKIEAEIAAATNDLHNLEIKKAKVEARLQTLREMLELWPDDPPARRRNGNRGRMVKDEWRQVLWMMMKRYPEGASYDDLFEMTQAVGIAPKQKANLRGHMGNYKAAGYVESPSAGIFVVTQKGAELALEKEDAGPAAKSDPASSGVDDQGSGLRPAGPQGSSPDTSTSSPSPRDDDHSDPFAPVSLDEDFVSFDDDEVPF